MNIKEYKGNLRKEIKCNRMLMTQEKVMEKSRIICQKILNHKKYQNSTCIYCYYPVQNEVDILPVIKHALNNGKTIALPKVINKQGEMIFAEIKSLDNLIIGHYNIPEPQTTEQAGKADLVLVPGVVFSTKGKRIGQAGGFYDRFLEKNNPYTIGVAYDFQVMNDIKTQSHDINVCEVISNI